MAFDAPKPREDDPCFDLDRKTYSAVREALETGAPVQRDFLTGAIVPVHLRGVGYGAGDLLASRFAEIDVEMKPFEASQSRPSRTLQVAPSHTSTTSGKSI